MRTFVIALALLACITTVRADPFAVRRPANMPASATPVQKDEPLRVVVDPGASRKRAAVYVAIGGGVLWGVSAIISKIERAKFDRSVAQEPVDYMAANHAMLTCRVYCTGIFAAGSIAVATSILLYVTAPEKRTIERIVVPTVGNDSVGVSYSGGF